MNENILCKYNHFGNSSACLHACAVFLSRVHVDNHVSSVSICIQICILTENGCVSGIVCEF